MPAVHGQPAESENGNGHLRGGEPQDGRAGARHHVQELREPHAAPGLLFPGLRVRHGGRGGQATAVRVYGVRVQNDRRLGGPGTGTRCLADGHRPDTVRPAVRWNARRAHAG